MERESKWPKRLVIASVLLFVVIGGFLAIGGMYGVSAIVWGRNPFRLIGSSPTRIDETKVYGTMLVVAVRAFKERHGRYPAALDELVPQFMPLIPSPTVGDGVWKYRLDEQKGFVLEYFIGPMYQKMWHDGMTDDWQADI